MGGKPIRFISDVHLPVDGTRGTSGRTRAFMDFLGETARDAARGGCETLYMLGDLFDFWYEAGGRAPRGFEEALGAMREAVSAGLRIVALPGNRDFLLGRAFATETGAEVAPEELEITLGGKRVRLTHGDLLARGDHRFQVWRRFSRGGTFRRMASGMPPLLARIIARALRRGSEFEKSVKPRSAMAYSDGALRSAVARGADVIIAGHVHEPAEIAIAAGGRTGRLLVLGTWDEDGGAYVEWTGEQLRLVR